MEPRVVLLEISRGLLRDFRGVFPYFRADVTPTRPLFHVRFLPARARVFFFFFCAFPRSPPPFVFVFPLSSPFFSPRTGSGAASRKIRGLPSESRFTIKSKPVNARTRAGAVLYFFLSPFSPRFQGLLGQ